MDPMPLLRSFRDRTPEPDEARLLAVRAPLQRRMTAAAAPAVRRPRAARRVVLGGLAAVAATGLAAALVTAGPAPQASAEAARLLDAAAGSARAQTGSGGFRTVVVRLEGLSLQLDAGTGDVVAAYNTRTVQTTRVPAGAGTWTRTSRPLPPDAFYGGAAARALAEREGALDAPADTEAVPRLERSADGTFTNGELGGGTLFGDDAAVLRALPRDPQALLGALRAADLGAEQHGQAAHVLAAASAVLRSGAADGDLQAAVFEALRLQRGLAIADASVRVDDRIGVAIGEAHPSWRFDASQLLIDPDTGEYLGDRDVALLPQGVVPAGAVLSATTVVRG